MVNVASSFQQGFGFAREQDRAAAAEEQRIIERQRQNAARDALVQRFGVEAGDPTTLGQLEGIDQRRTAFDRGVEDEDAARRQQAIMNAAGMYQQAIDRGAPPDQAAASVARVLPLIAPNEEVAGQALQVLSSDPTQAESVFRSLSGEGIAEPEYGEAGFYEVGGQEAYGRPVQQPDGTVAFEELPFQPQQESFERVQVAEDPTGIYERNAQTGRLRLVGRRPQSRSAGGGTATERRAAHEDEATNRGRERLNDTLIEASQIYTLLDESGGVPTPERAGLGNLVTAIARGAPGVDTVLGAIGDEDAQLALRLGGLRADLINGIREATGMSSRSLDSNRELEFYLQAATDPARDIISNYAALYSLDRRYGLGMAVESIIPPDRFAEVQRRSGQLVTEAPPPPDGEGADVAAPSPGDIVDGYEFTGGNPADPQNWREVE